MYRIETLYDAIKTFFFKQIPYAFTSSYTFFRYWQRNPILKHLITPNESRISSCWKNKHKLSENQYLENFLVTAIGTPHLNFTFFTLYIIIVYNTVYMVNKIVKFRWGSSAYGDSELIHCYNEYVISL